MTQQFLRFPKSFLWGCATAAYQVEGGIERNDWAKIFPAGAACDHYHRYEEDFNLLEDMGQNAYRFSIEWSRIEPEEGCFDEKEIEHYRVFLLELKRRHIQTFVTMHHFTNPEWFAKAGGWASSKAVYYFSRFAMRLLDEYEGLVDFWITINEPLVYASTAYITGLWPPQKKNVFLFLKVLRNQVAAHKKAYEILHTKAKQECRVGIAKSNIYFEPAAKKSFLDKLSASAADYFWNRYFLDTIKNRLDFIGLNYYFHKKVDFPLRTKNENRMTSDIGWEIYPEGIYHVLAELERYKKPVYITENGVADNRDFLRKDFIRDHLYWIYKAIQKGVDVRGYLHWSLLDNFEWEKGFRPRFGLIEIDYKTMERRPRPSARYYYEICKNNGFEL